MPEKLYIALYKAALALSRLLPRAVLDALFCTLAWVWFHAGKKHRTIVCANIAHALPALTPAQVAATARATYRNYAFFATDFLRNARATREDVLAQVEFEGAEHLQAALAAGRGVIVQTAHYGNWELFSLAMAARFGAVSIVGRGLDSGAMNAVLSEHRRQFDIELINKFHAAKPMLAAIKSGRLLGVLIDQAVSASEGVECEFFGRRIMHSPALSIIAAKTGAAIVPAFIYRKERRRCAIRFFAPIWVAGGGRDEIIRATAAQCAATEQMVRFKPNEYFWFHKKFKNFYSEIYGQFNRREHDK